MSFVGSNILAGASGQGDAGYKIERSLRFNSADDSSLSRTFATGNRKEFTFSCWIKRTDVSDENNILVAGSGSPNCIRFSGDNSITIKACGGNVSSSGIFRDPSSWYHIVVVVNSTETTQSDRIKLYVNGVLETLTGTGATLNGEADFNSATDHYIGKQQHNTSNDLNGYLADVHFIDGQALAASNFGEFDDNNVWQPKKFDGSYLVAGTGSNPTSTSNVAPSGGYGNTIPSAALLFSFAGPTSATSHIRQDGGGMEWSPAITLSGSDVAGAFLTYFNNASSSFSVEFKINGSWTTAQSNAQNVIGSTQNQGALITLQTTGSWTGVRVTGGSNVSVSGVTGIYKNGTRLNNGQGDNSFRLDFADNSSDSALGTDSSGNNNTWTVNNLKAVDAFGILKAASITSSQTISFPITYGTTVTYEFFVQVTTASTYTYFAHDVTGQDRWNIGINSSDSLLFGNYNGGWTTFSSVGLTDGNWHFVRVTTTGSSTSLYVDGSLVGTNSSGGSVSTGSQITNKLQSGAFKIAHLRITNGGTPPTTGIPAISSMNQAAGSGGTLAFYDALDDIASTGTKTSDGGNVTITMAAATAVVSQAGVDSLIDTPTDYVDGSGNNGGNYCTLNPLAKTVATLSDGNLLYEPHGSTQHCVGSTFAVASGKYYWEYTIESTGNYHYAGIADVATNYTGNWCGSNSGWSVSVNTAGNISHNNAENHGNIGTSPASGQTWGWALDMDAGTLKVYINGSIQYSGNSIIPSSTSLAGRTITPAAGHSAHKNLTFNFGQRPFAYTPPTGHVSLCTANFADPTIEDGSKAFDILTWTGDGTGARTVSGLNLSDAPDFVWSKTRNHAYHNNTWDSVRGYGTSATALITDYLGSANGGTLNSATASSLIFSGGVWHNQSAKTYVAWAWDGGDLATTSSSSYNQTNTWSSSSSFASTTGFRSSEPETNAFDGNTDTICSAVGNGVVTFTSPVTFSSSSTIRVFVHGGDHTVTVNGGSNQTVTAGSFQTITFSNPSASTFTITFQRASSADTGIRAIEIGGKILLDPGTIPVGGMRAASTVSSGNAYSAAWAGLGTGTWANSDSWSGLSAVSNNAKGYFSSTENLSNGSVISVANGSFGAGSNGSNGWVLRASSTVTLDLTVYPNITEIATTSSDSQTFADRTVVATNPSSGSSLVVTGKCFWFSTTSQMSVSTMGTVNDAPAAPSIATTVRANPNYGFSISKADVAASLTGGPTVAHGLNAKPDFIIGKNVDSLSIYWRVFHKDLQENHYLGLNRRDAEQNSSAVWGDNNSLDSNVFQIGSGTPASMWIPSGTDTCIFYAWSEVEGYSKFGSYTGNGAVDGPFVYTGFRPKWILIKNATTTGDEWMIYDTEREQFNVMNNALEADTADSENTGGYDIDIVSNGFKPRSSNVRINGSGNKNIYAAFAEHPFKSARAR